VIDWDQTKNEFGYDITSVPYRGDVIVICDECGNQYTRKYRGKVKTGPHACKKCVSENSDTRSKISSASKALWQDNEYKNKVIERLNDPNTKQKLSEHWYRRKHIINSENYRSKISESIKRLWTDDQYRKSIVANSLSMWGDRKLKERMLASRRTESYRNNQRTKAINRWADPEYKEKQEKHRSNRSPERLSELRQKQSKVSKLQDILYSILDDLGIKYYREYNDRDDDPQCKIGPYNFDCVIPRDNMPDLLIEYQGEYWHKIRHIDDKRKSSYISNNFTGIYELKYIWEHEFYNRNKIKETIKYWVGLTEIPEVDFEFNQITISKCCAKDYKILLTKYHYLPTAGRGGIAYGAYLGSTLIAVCIFSNLLRQNVDHRKNVCELSRLCIHPGYQKKNFASWFISRCIKLSNYSIFISYADTTFDHDGSVYKAANFKYVGKVAPDYWYMSADGWIMHKKTLYNRAVTNSMTEKEYATANGYTKIWGKEKLKFEYCK